MGSLQVSKQMDTWTSGWVSGKHIACVLTGNWENQDGEILEAIDEILLSWYKFPSSQCYCAPAYLIL